MKVFKVGDRVRCKESNPGQFTAGKEYTVRYLDGVSLGVTKDDAGDENGWNVRYFEPIQSTKLKVGDRVCALVDYNDVCKGIEYTISFVDLDCYYYLGDDLMFEKELELIAPPAKFKVGQLVRHKRLTDDAETGVGKVLSVDGNIVSLKWSGNLGKSTDPDDALYLVELQPSPRTTTAIVIGEKGAATFPFRHPNKAAAISEADRLAVKFPGQKFEVYELASTRRGSVSVGEV